MATQYTTTLKLALPTQGELTGTWGDVVNENITSMVEEAIAGRAVINTWSTNSHTLTTANGTTSESRCAMLEFTDTGAALTGAGTVICPANPKIYLCKNDSGQAITVKTSAGTGIAVQDGEAKFVFCDGTNVVEAVTSMTTLKIGTGTQVDGIIDDDSMATASATKLATSESIKAYVDAQVGANNELSEVLANGNTTGGTDIAVSAGDDITFADNSKAIFGAGSDLQIYHDGTNSYIDDAGTGVLNIRAESYIALSDMSNKVYMTGTSGGAVGLRFNDAQKLATTSTGVDVTGTVTADGLTVDGDGYFGGATVGGTDYPLRIQNTDTGISAGVGIEFSIDGVNDVIGSTIRSDRTGAAYHQSAVTISNRRANGAGLVSGFKLDQNGNISFYEDTGTTAKFFWDASAEALGIGTSSPLMPIHLSGTGDTGIQLTKQGSVASRIKTVAGALAIGVDGSNGDTERMRIDSSGNVGIGTSSPSQTLHVSVGGTNTDIKYLQIDGGGASGSVRGQMGIGFRPIAAGTNVHASIEALEDGNGTYNTNLLFKTNGSGTDSAPTERLRIDSSGNLLVGVTSATGNAAGQEFRAGGATYITRDGNTPLVTNRKTSDGAIQEFRKDGATVGSIQSRSGLVTTMIFDPRASGAGITGGGPVLYPTNNTGALTNNLVSLGDPTYNFKDLYLSGGVYLGGTGAANLLDDYEEGTWTPFWANGTSLVYSEQIGRYVKVGSTVFYHLSLIIASGTITQKNIAGLPFACSSSGSNYHMSGGIWNTSSITYPAGTTRMVIYTAPSTTQLTVECHGSGIAPALPSFASNTRILASGTYLTDA